MRKPKLKCPKCKKYFPYTQMQKHHIYPKRYYSKSPYSCYHKTVSLCEECHVKVEALYRRQEIAFGKGMRKSLGWWYKNLFNHWLDGGYDWIWEGKYR